MTAAGARAAGVAAYPITFSGVAFNDGTARLEAVLVSFDRGMNWRQAALRVPRSPDAWYPWTIEEDLAPGTYEIGPAPLTLLVELNLSTRIDPLEPERLRVEWCAQDCGDSEIAPSHRGEEQ